MVSSQWFSVRPLTGIVTLAVAAALLAGCGSAQSGFAPQSVTQSSSAVTHASVIEPDSCKNSGGVRATPCRVQLTASNPVIDVSVKTPNGAKGTVVEHDSCGGASGIASITGSDNSWVVTAGAVKGHCKARFNYFNNNQKVGWARIKIQNQ